MKIIRYLCVGSIAAATDIFFFISAVKILQLDWFFVSLASFMLATTINYIFSVIYVFESGTRFRRRTEASLVFMVSSIGLLVNQTTLWLLIDTFNIDEIISKIMATASVFFWNYMTRSNFIFKENK